ncbi:MAG: hypothetical protein RLZZ401_1383 [Pseudomonadota bacterium]|jgi:hypothetical protein
MPIAIAPQPAPGYYSHTDGGIYEVINMARDSRDGSPVVIYNHVWPFEAGTWVRPLTEWASRFTPVTADKVALAKHEDRALLQATITAERAKRKAG